MPISEKQRKILAFPFTKNYQSLICDGAVRSGKTSIMTVAFVDWAMREFSNTNFAICGKTVGSAVKNIVTPYMSLAYARKRYAMRYVRNENKLTVTRGGRTNVFYIYGGRDESSYMLIQGITLAGVLFDEVALMTRSFVEQALARCLSFKHRRYFFNCNPENPQHWFYLEWIKQPEKHRALHLHFLMSDNPALDPETIREAALMYPGVFYRRYVLGQWVAAEGAVYPNFAECVVDHLPDQYDRYVVSMDYGIQNATAMILWGRNAGVWYAIKEYYYSGRENREQKTDDDYWKAYVSLTKGLGINGLVIDPSAASFIVLASRHGVHVLKADNDVLDGIRDTASAIQRGKIKVSRDCVRLRAEADSYVWDAKAKVDRPIKVGDHAMDAVRYFVRTVVSEKKVAIAVR